MKTIVALTFVVLLFGLSNPDNAECLSEPEASPEQKEPVTIGAPPNTSELAGPEQKGSEAGEVPPGVHEIFFAAGTISADDKYLYVIFDRFLLQYALPALDLKRKLDLNIASAPVAPSISISKDSKWLYVVSNGILYQIDATTFKIGKQIKIIP